MVIAIVFVKTKLKCRDMVYIEAVTWAISCSCSTEVVSQATGSVTLSDSKSQSERKSRSTFSSLEESRRQRRRTDRNGMRSWIYFLSDWADIWWGKEYHE